MTVESSSPVAHIPLATLDQWVVVVGHIFNGGLYVVGLFASEAEADEWVEEANCGYVVPLVDAAKTCIDRLGYPLHNDESFRS